MAGMVRSCSVCIAMETGVIIKRKHIKNPIGFFIIVSTSFVLIDDSLFNILQKIKTIANGRRKG
jgi:hypothetical protein